MGFFFLRTSAQTEIYSKKSFFHLYIFETINIWEFFWEFFLISIYLTSKLSFFPFSDFA